MLRGMNAKTMRNATWMMGAAAAISGCAGDPSAGPEPGRRVSEAAAAARGKQDVDRLVGAVSSAKLRDYVDRLAAFGTRQTLSDTTSPTRGIGASREWIKAEFERIARESGRPSDGPEAIKVYFDSHRVQPDGRRITREVDIVNVICEIPGSSPEARVRLYYMTGHYDSICSDFVDAECDAPGANDNASGTAALMECARVMAREKFDGTVVLMATAGEEQGLYGARLHAKAARDKGLDIRADLNNDIMGDPLGQFHPERATWVSGPRTSESGSAGIEFRAKRLVRLFCEGVPNPVTPIPEGSSAEGATSASTAGTPTGGTDPKREAQLRKMHAMGMENDGAARTLARYVAEIADMHELPVRPMIVYRNDRFLRGGDHTAFIEHGYTSAVRFTAPHEDYNRQHQNVRIERETRPDGSVWDVQYGDLPQYVDEVYLAGVTKVNLAALAHLARAPEEPKNARIVTAKLMNDTMLRWAPPADKDVAGYEIVWRATTSPMWEGAIDAGNVMETTVRMSKDHHFFGVRAYDRDGYRGPVAVVGAARE